MDLRELFALLQNTLYGSVLPLLLMGGGVFFLIRLRFFLFRHPVRTARILFRREEGGASPFRATVMALAGTLGVGNISGVALALLSGGAGALFWMVVAAFLAMVLKYAEVTLALRFRKDGDGSAMRYMEEGVGGRHGKRLATVFAVLCLFATFTVGSLVQANAVAEAAAVAFSLPSPLVGAALMLFAALVVFGGVKKISAATSALIPPATLLYVLLCLFVILRNLNGIPAVCGEILASAFDFRAAGGGVFGFFFSRAVRFGTTRGLLSNEAGCGTAPMAHATSGSRIPAKQGLCGVLEVFVDTVLLCSLTGFAVLLALPEIPNAGGIGIVIAAFSAEMGSAAPLLVSLLVTVFATATVLCWAYYGEAALRYLSTARRLVFVYRFLFCLSLFVGAVLAVDAVFALTDLVLAAMTVQNVLVLLRLSPLVKSETDVLYTLDGGGALW